MTILTSYSMQVFFCMLLLYIYFLVFLSARTHHSLNRIYLLLLIPLSFLLPALHIPVHIGSPNADGRVLLQIIQIGDPKNPLESTSFHLPVLIWIVYLTGFLFFLYRFSLSLIHILRIRRQSHIKKKSGHKVAIHNLPIAPFSFGRTIYIQKQTLQDPLFHDIMKHELTHVSKCHTMDILFFELLCIILWFNPLHHLIKISLKEQHEYQADTQALAGNQDNKHYLSLMFESALGLQPLVAHPFNYSLTKKRINMITKHAHQRSTAWAALLSLPLLAVLFLAFTCQEGQARNTLSSEIATSSQVVINIPDSFTPLDEPSFQDKKAFQTVTTEPSFKGGPEALIQHVNKETKYPPAARKQGIEGVVYVKFTVSETGKVQEASIERSVHPDLDKEALRVVSSMPDWIPGKSNGQAVAVKMTLPVKFKLDRRKE